MGLASAKSVSLALACLLVILLLHHFQNSKLVSLVCQQRQQLYKETPREVHQVQSEVRTDVRAYNNTLKYFTKGH